MLAALGIPLLAAVLAQDDVCHVELMSFNVRSDHFSSETVAEIAALNLSPLELADVRFEVSFYDSGGRLGTIGPVAVTRMAPRRGAEVVLRDSRRMPEYTSARVKVAYRIEGVEHTFEFSETRLTSGSLYREPGEGLRLGTAGLVTVPGAWKTEGKKSVYTGDTLFLVLRVEDLPEKDRPIAAVEVTFFQGEKKEGTVKRQIEAGHWKLNAKEIPAEDASPKIIGYDAAAKELHVALCRVDEGFDLKKRRLNVKFTWKKKTWTWIDLDPPFLEAPRPPDHEKK